MDVTCDMPRVFFTKLMKCYFIYNIAIYTYICNSISIYIYMCTNACFICISTYCICVVIIVEIPCFFLQGRPKAWPGIARSSGARRRFRGLFASDIKV